MQLVLSLALVGMVLTCFHFAAYCFRQGFRAGREAADQWWMGMEREVGEARQKIRQEEE
jgi:hypothetical protein